MMAETVGTQFATLGAAAQGCDVIVGATALQIAAPSIAEQKGIPYIFAAYCPAVLPSQRHAPPTFFISSHPSSPADFERLWAEDAARVNDGFAPPLNARREGLGLAPVKNVRAHVFTRQPWLACDPVLAPWTDAPWTDAAGNRPVETGAWVVDDRRPLDADLERFLDAGDAPIYFGFGSIRAPAGASAAMVGAARECGRRAVLLRGWADLAPPDDGPDCIVVGEVNQQALFPRVAAVVHHGGAGTTTAAALAASPQVIIPQHYDQPYWAQQVERLGVGVAHAPGAPTQATLTAALARVMNHDVAASARRLSVRMRRDGARRAALQLVAL